MDNDYREFVNSIKNKTGIDLAQYKESQMKRRLESLRDKRGYKTFKQYYEAISRDRDLLNEFLDRITINVTEFYRNYKRWEVLEKQIIPSLLKSGRNLKIWSAACSTGEEPYTIAMLLSKFLPLSQISILATDIDANVIERAKVGFYSERSMVEVPEEMKKKYFTKDGSGYVISDEIKNTVKFRKHNLLEDAYPNDYDLIICRNVLIYFTEEAKEGIFDKFGKALRRDGILFVGSTEQIFTPSKYGFDTEDTFFYKKK